jgi:cytochrome c-type biogenesis protein CcmE
VTGPPSVVTGTTDDESADSAPVIAPADGRSVSGGWGGRDKRAQRQRRRLVAVAVILVAAFGFLLAKGLGSSLDYFETVNQALQSKATLGTKTFRLEGLVVPGSVHRHRGGVDFVASGSRGRIDVINSGNPPQLFQPDIPVVVVGHFAGDSFVSNQIIVDHTAQYVAQYPNRVKAPNGTSR